MKERLIQRYSRAERINHWIVAICFVLLAISGLAFFSIYKSKLIYEFG